VKLNGHARWISAIAGSILAGSLLAGGIVQTIIWAAEIDNHVRNSGSQLNVNANRIIRIEHLVNWLVKMQCTEMIRRGDMDALPQECLPLQSP
jgi:hypothetical protein